MTRVKVCGTTNLEDAELAHAHGAWAVGMVLWPQSKRACSIENAVEIGTRLHRRAEVAGVFVNQPLDDVAAIADSAQLTLIQLHGDEGPKYCNEAARRTGAKVIKAARVHDAADVRGIGAFGTEYHLLDSYVPGMPGGTGTTFAWDLARHHRGPGRLIIGGGLDPDNVGEVIATAHPFGVDIASGLEAEPGRKDPEAVSRFFESVAAADAALATL